MKKITLLLIAFLCSAAIYAQSNNSGNAPENDLGKTLNELRQKYTDLKYDSTDSEGRTCYMADKGLIYFKLAGGKSVYQSVVYQDEKEDMLQTYKLLTQSILKETAPIDSGAGDNKYFFEYAKFTLVVNYIADMKCIAMIYNAK